MAQIAWVIFCKINNFVGIIFFVKAMAWSRVDIPPKDIINVQKSVKQV